MSPPQQKTLGFVNYPVGRPAFFAIRFQTHVLRRGVAYEVGTDGLAVLMLVSTAEDRTRYTKPVAFWNDHLCGMVGLSRERFFAARKKLVERGWLCYTPGARGRAPTYFVTVPGGDQEIDGSMLGETPADEVIRDDERRETREKSQIEEVIVDSTSRDELGRISRLNSPPIAISIHHQSPTQFTTPSILYPESEESSSLSPERLSERNTLSASPLPREEEFEEVWGESQSLGPMAYGQNQENDDQRKRHRDGCGSRGENLRKDNEIGYRNQTQKTEIRGGLLPNDVERTTENAVAELATEAQRHGDSVRANGERGTPCLSQKRYLVGEPGVGPFPEISGLQKPRPVGESTGTGSSHSVPLFLSVTVPSPLALGPRPSPLGRAELLTLLRADFPAGFGIRRAVWTLDTALKSITLEQVSAIVSHAWDRQIDGVLPWNAGAVVMRLTDPDLVALPPEEGWAPPNPEWVKLDQRRKHAADSAERQRLAAAKAQADEDKRVAEHAKREQLELAFGPTLDELEQTAPDRLWSILREWGMESFVRKSGSGFRGNLARQKLLRAVEAGQLGEG